MLRIKCNAGINPLQRRTHHIGLSRTAGVHLGVRRDTTESTEVMELVV